MYDLINSISQIPDGYTFKDIRCLYGTGTTIGGRRSSAYRHGIMTPIGDIELSIWRKAAQALISKEQEKNIYNALLAWTTENCPWLHKNQEQIDYALELHVNRIFLDPKWVCFEEFKEYLNIPDEHKQISYPKMELKKEQLLLSTPKTGKPHQNMLGNKLMRFFGVNSNHGWKKLGGKSAWTKKRKAQSKR